MSRAARGHVRGGLAHTQREVRIGAKQLEWSELYCCAVVSTACPKLFGRTPVATGYKGLLTKAVNTGSRLAAGIIPPANTGLAPGARIEQVVPEVPPVPAAHGL